MHIPSGFNNKTTQNMVCRLRKTICVFKHSLRAWFKKFAKAVIRCAFTQTQCDHTLFTRIIEANKITLLIVYVDTIVTGNNTDGI